MPQRKPIPSSGDFNADLMTGIRHNKLTWVRQALQYGADPMYNNGEPLRAAIQVDNVNIAKALIRGGARLDYYNGELLTYALRNHLVDFIEFLRLQSSVFNLAISDDTVELAYLSGYPEFYMMTRETYARIVNAITTKPLTLFLGRSYEGRAEYRLKVVRQLLRHNFAQQYDWVPVFKSALAKRQYRLVVLLLGVYNGMRYLDPKIYGVQALIQALDDRNSDMVGKILDVTGLSADMMDEAPLKTALVNGDRTTVDALIRRGAHVTAPSVRALIEQLNQPEFTALLEDYSATISCPICLEECPRNSAKACANNHVQCRSCYEGWKQTQRNNHREVTCPECRGHIQTSPVNRMTLT